MKKWIISLVLISVSVFMNSQIAFAFAYMDCDGKKVKWVGYLKKALMADNWEVN